MPMNNRDKLKLLLILLLIMIPAGMVTPFGNKWMHSKGIEGSPFWMKAAILASRITLSSEQAAEYSRQYYLLWPTDPSASQMILDSGGDYFNLGRTAEKGPQYRLLTRAWDILQRMKLGNWTEIPVMIEDEEVRLPVKISSEERTQIEARLEWMRDWHNKNLAPMQDEEWDWGLADTWKFIDQWDRRKVR